nr:hypothetical protein [Fredinandcohnia onubensis]
MKSQLMQKIHNKILIECLKIKSNPLRELTEAFLREPSLLQDYEIQNQSKIERSIRVIRLFISVVIIENLFDYGWTSYCNQMHIINKHKEVSIKGRTRELLQRFYIFILRNCKNKDVITEINSCFPYLLPYEVKFENKKISRDFIQTNFPKNTSLKQIHQIKVSRKKNPIINININTKNIILEQLLRSFADNISINYSKYTGSSNVRLFFYYFEASLSFKKIQKLTDFDINTFRQQYNFFQQWREEFDIHITNSLLTKFYLFIDDFSLNTKGKRLFNSTFNRDLITNSWFIKYLNEGYTPVFRSVFEEVPIQDKLLILHQEKDKIAAASVTNITIDFTKVINPRLKEELKEYIWSLDVSLSGVRDGFRELVLFLNEANQFYEKIIPLQENNGYFSYDFILIYISRLKLRKNKKGENINLRTINNIKGFIREYLRHIKDKYNVSDIVIAQIKDSKKTYNGGNPMDPDDFQEISQEFRVRQNKNSNGELYFIIFQLSIQTKLRKGEILNLKTDSIPPFNNTNFGVIEYFSKTSKGEIIKEIFLPEDIALINRAIQITKNCRDKAPEDLKSYIFIKFREFRHTSEVHRASQGYDNFYQKIINDLYQKGKIKKRYSPYDARDTYMDGTWNSVEDGLISSLEAGVITGNTPKVAAQSYRKYDTIRYVEATYKITIGDVNIAGEITVSDEEIKSLQQVEQGAGGCKSDDCIKKDVISIGKEDSAYKCLTCSKFVTSLQRVEIFENRLEEYKKFKNEANSQIEKDYYSHLIELYAGYLAKMYILME